MSYRHFIACLLLAAQPLLPAVAAETRSDPALLQALASGDWQTVGPRLAGLAHPGPIDRLLAAHAFLATDQGNRAYCNFASVARKADRDAWLQWATRFAASRPDSASALYLRGDAHARLEQWDDAIRAFSQALAFKPDNALALNARALAFAARGEWSLADKDLLVAARQNGAPLDVKANTGVLSILRRGDAEWADTLFQEVLQRDQQHFIARVGRGAAAAAQQEWDRAKYQFALTDKERPCTDLAMENLLLADQAEAARVAGDFGARPGTDIMRDSTQPTWRPADAAAVKDTLAGLKALQDANAHIEMGKSGLESVRNVTNAMAAAAGSAALKSFGPSPVGLAAAGGVGALRDWANKSLDSNIARLDRQAGDNGKHMEDLARWGAAARPSVSTPSSFERHPGGLNSAPPVNAWDNGAWPVVLWPVLLYTVHPADSSNPPTH